ncbi:hypothetical protein [Carnobacterium maltaromaticum]|uniref:hypothetical protein n=1 Tax=Carnobacterium maltaromaticum TaxID=2751 RepID=UPI0012F852B6|nr:hypothetical protein [Carnobacterium maltaromaticum]
MKNENNELEKLYLEQEKEIEGAEFVLDAVTNESPIFTVCVDQTFSEFFKGEEMIDAGHCLQNTDGKTRYLQYFTNGKAIEIEHFSKENGDSSFRLLQDSNQSKLDRLNSIKKNIEAAIELQKQIETLEVE